jgi:phosphohistidine phosphatase
MPVWCRAEAGENRAMKILFVRHAQAEERGHGKPGLDEERRIVTKGESATRALAVALERLRLRPKFIFTSPLVRSLQTAEILADHIKHAPDPIKTRALSPGASWADFKREIARHGAKLAGKKGRSVLLFAVGHQPNLSEMITEALCGEPSSFDFAKSACVGLAWEDDKPHGAPAVFFALEPDVAKRLAE